MFVHAINKKYNFSSEQPESYWDWNEFADFEINKKSKCELYLKEELELPEWAKPVWREMGCEYVILKD